MRNREGEELQEIAEIAATRELGLGKEKKETRIIKPEEVLLGYEEITTVMREDGTIETHHVAKVREYSDGLILNKDGKIVAVRCQNKKCRTIVSNLNYFECRRCGKFFCRNCVKEKSVGIYFCLHCWKIITFFPFLQKKYLISPRIEIDHPGEIIRRERNNEIQGEGI